MPCCTLHNRLLKVDGLNIEWNGDVGLFDIDETDGTIPFDIRRLQTGTEQRHHDSSGMGPGFIDDVEVDSNEDDDMRHIDCNQNIYENNNDEFNQNEVNNVSQLSSRTMRDKLIKHFDILFHMQKVQWPRS